MAYTRPKPVNYQERIAQQIRSRAELVAQSIAAQLGPPSDSKEVDSATMLKLWNHKVEFDPNTGQRIDPQDLLNKGMPISQIVDTIYPYRRKMTMYGRPNPQDQVKFAERMNKQSGLETSDPESNPEDTAEPSEE